MSDSLEEAMQFNKSSHLYITHISFIFQVSVLPPLASIMVTSIAAQVADKLIASGTETTVVCKQRCVHTHTHIITIGSRLKIEP